MLVQKPRVDAQPSVRSRALPIILVGFFLVAAIWAFTHSESFAANAIPSISGTGWWFVLLGLAGVCVSFLCAAAVLIGLSPVPIPIHVAVIAQWAAAGSKVITPASSGVIGINARLLVKHGVSVTSSMTTVVATQVAQLGTTAVLVALLAPIVGALPRLSLPANTWWWIAAAVAVAAVGGAFFYRLHLQRPRAPGEMNFTQRFGTALRSITGALQSPRRLFLISAGSLGLTFSLAVCMWSMVQAVGGYSTFLVATFVMMVGAGLGNFVPTPGGVGGVEASMIAVFLAAGQAGDVALQSVLMFRLLSFWVPAPLGALAALWLHRNHCL